MNAVNWHPIPGYEAYEVSARLQVRRRDTGYVIRLHHKNGYSLSKHNISRYVTLRELKGAVEAAQAAELTHSRFLPAVEMTERAVVMTEGAVVMTEGAVEMTTIASLSGLNVAWLCPWRSGRIEAKSEWDWAGLL